MGRPRKDITREPTSVRDVEIGALKASGMSFKHIGEKVGISKTML